jgi:hypothetical protein
LKIFRTIGFLTSYIKIGLTSSIAREMEVMTFSSVRKAFRPEMILAIYDYFGNHERDGSGSLKVANFLATAVTYTS